MKNLLLIVVFALFTITATAQEKPTPNTGNVVEKANHNTSRSNQRPGGIADLNADTGEDQAGIFEKKKCVNAGGTYYELPSGKKFCMPRGEVSTKSINVSTEQVQGIFERRKCLKSGGMWLTCSQGSMCHKKLNSKN